MLDTQMNPISSFQNPWKNIFPDFIIDRSHPISLINRPLYTTLDNTPRRLKDFVLTFIKNDVGGHLWIDSAIPLRFNFV